MITPTERSEKSPKAQEGHRLHRAKMQFASRVIEVEFSTAIRTSQLQSIRLAICTGLFLNTIYYFWDRFAFSAEKVGQAILIRQVGANSFLAALLAASFAPIMKRHPNALFTFGLLTYAGFFAALNTVEETAYIYLGNGILIVISAYLFIIGNFVLANVTGLAASIVLAGVVGVYRDTTVEYVMFVLLLVGTNMFGAVIQYQAELLRRSEFIAVKALTAERKRFRDLLVRVLPERVADRLQQERGVSESHEKVVVLFADVVGFTSMAARVEPGTVVSWLNELFKKFDGVIASHGLEKIKTIGDAYMAASGLAGAAGSCDGALAAAAELVAVAEQHPQPNGSPTQIRVGLHTGPASAGIIGESRFLYDLWGDTVNVASRMAAASLPGEVLMTTEVRNGVKSAYELEECPETLIRGKGLMTTWRLHGPKPLHFSSDAGPAPVTSP